MKIEPLKVAYHRNGIRGDHFVDDIDQAIKAHYEEKAP